MGTSEGEVDANFSAGVGPSTFAEPADAPEAHERLGQNCYSVEDLSGARQHWDTAFLGFSQAGDLKSQARIAINLGRLHFSSLGNEAAGRGWLSRAERLLNQVGRCVEQGHLALALLACEIRDAAGLEKSAALALELAEEFGDADLQYRALADSGVALVSQGRIADGFARLDEAMVPVVAGEVAYPGGIFCSMLTACERAGELGRAEEWIRLCQELVVGPMQGRFPVMQAHCRVAYGSVLCIVGRWSEAEAEIMQALGPTGTIAVARRSEAIARLADLRIRQGRLEEAADLLQPIEDRFEAGETLARLHVALGEPDLAVAVIRRVLAQLGSDRLRGVPLLALLVQAELARADIGAAEASATYLAEFIAGTDSAVLRAEVALAEGRVATGRGEHAKAVASYEMAQRELIHEERPLLAATICLERAELAGAMGDVATSIAEARAAIAIFERVGAERDADRASALLRRLGSSGRRRAHDRAGALAALSQREQEVLKLVAEGRTNPEIAQRLFISPKTAEHHVGNILTKLGVRSRGEAAAFAASTATRPRS